MVQFRPQLGDKIKYKTLSFIRFKKSLKLDLYILNDLKLIRWNKDCPINNGINTLLLIYRIDFTVGI